MKINSKYFLGENSARKYFTTNLHFWPPTSYMKLCSGRNAKMNMRLYFQIYLSRMDVRKTPCSL